MKLALRSRILFLPVMYLGANLYETSLSTLKTQELWKYIMKHCIGYPQIVLVGCALVAERYPGWLEWRNSRFGIQI